MLKKTQNRIKRAQRTRARITQGTSQRPRLSIFRSNSHIYAQVIDDSKSSTLAAASDLKITKGTKTERAQEVGTQMAKIMKEKGIHTCVFDRGGYLYHGRVKMLAHTLRENGITF